jgi:putative endonuclease
VIVRCRDYHVYILASRSRRLYVGVTRDLRRRVWQHQRGLLPGFTRRYGITALVHAEHFSDARTAIAREKQLKRWPRWRKDRLIEASNPAWADLSSAPWDHEET